MARNLQAKLPPADTIRVYDINTEAVERFAKDTKALGTGAAVEAASSIREAAENSVSYPIILLSFAIIFILPFYVMSLFHE